MNTLETLIKDLTLGNFEVNFPESEVVITDNSPYGSIFRYSPEVKFGDFTSKEVGVILTNLSIENAKLNKLKLDLIEKVKVLEHLSKSNGLCSENEHLLNSLKQLIGNYENA